MGERLPSLPAGPEVSVDRFRSAFDHGLLPAWICDPQQRYTDVNEALCEMLGRPREELIGRAVSDSSHRDEVTGDQQEFESMLTGERDGCTREKRLVRADGTPDGAVIWVLVATRLIRARDGTPLYFVAQANDLTDYRLREQRLRHLADHDALTGLLNRRGFGRELRRHISRLERYGSKGALLMLDLDNFKRYNDAHGHAAGDDLLQTVSVGLSRRLRAGDMIGRIGGDEFAVLLPEASGDQASVVGAALVEAVREIPQGDDRPVTASVGIFSFDDVEQLSADGAMVGADLAMYAAKRAGRDRHAPFSGHT